MKDRPNSPYAPVRLKTEYWYEFAKDCVRKRLIVQDGRIASHLPQVIFEHLVTPASKMIIDQNDGIVDSPVVQTIAVILGLRQWIPLIAQYELSGKQIFDLGDDLINMLENTDVKDATLESWNSPFDSFYTRFGKRDSIKLPYTEEDGTEIFEHVDGAFIAVTPHETGGQLIKIGFTMIKEDESPLYAPGYYIDITPNEQKLSVDKAVESALNRRLKELKDDDSVDEYTVVLQQYRVSRMEEAFDLLKNSFSLIINCLFYLESIDINLLPKKPGRNATPEIDVLWQNAKASNNAQKLTSVRKKVDKNGYTIVYFAGHDINNQQSSEPLNSRDISTHWRRGHWRNQPFGKKLSQIKRIWLKPKLINAHDDENIDIPGHIYMPSSSNKIN
jgi:hypothetical protein